MNDLNIKIFEDLNLVRGLDYYCHTVFEFKTNEIGSQDTLIGGGRYNGLIKTLGGIDIPGIGWAAGIERISMLMELENISNSIIHLAISDEKYKNQLIKIINYFKENEIPFYWNYKYNIKKSLSKANSSKAIHAILIGENEFLEDFYTLKTLSTGKQIKLNINEIKKFFK